MQKDGIRLTGKQICLANDKGQMVSALSYIHGQYVIHREAWFEYAENNESENKLVVATDQTCAASILELRTLRVIIF